MCQSLLYLLLSRNIGELDIDICIRSTSGRPAIILTAAVPVEQANPVTAIALSLFLLLSAYLTKLDKPSDAMGNPQASEEASMSDNL